MRWRTLSCYIRELVGGGSGGGGGGGGVEWAAPLWDPPK